MRAALLTLALVAPLVALAPTALAAPACADVTTHATTPLGPYVEPAHSLTFHAWAETNLVSGLQKVACVDADGRLVAADAYLGHWGLDTGGLPICLPRLGCF